MTSNSARQVFDENVACYQCLLWIKDFETYWAYYSLSDGKLHPHACRDAARQMVLAMQGLETQLAEQVDSEVFSHLTAWGIGNSFEAATILLGMCGPLQTLLAQSKDALATVTGFALPPSKLDGCEILYRQSNTRWQAHFPTIQLFSMSDAKSILEKASASDTIVVVGDIRRSQDLMTYAQDQHSFAQRMVEFINAVRLFLDENLGIFDKFTGDGFVAYFSKALCEMHGQDYRQCFLTFTHDLTQFANKHFSSWGDTVRKLPEVPVGLSMGADIGQVLYQDIDAHFVAGGDAITWATRMLDIGDAAEIVLNNLLYVEVRNAKGVRFERRYGKTKAGEPFLSRVMRFD